MEDSAPGSEGPTEEATSPISAWDGPAPAVAGGALSPEVPDLEGTLDPQRSRRRLLVVAGVVAVVAVVLLSLLLAGFFGSQYVPFGSHPPAVTSLSFSQAFVLANSSAQSQGQWGLVSAIGLVIPPGAYNPLASLPVGNTTSVCGSTWGLSLVNAAAGDAAKGIAPNWLFEFESVTNNSVLSVFVVNGQAQVLGATPPDSHCLGAGRVGFLAPAPSIEDSPQIVHDLTNLTGFLDRFSNSSVFFEVTDSEFFSGKVSGTAVWQVLGMPCPPAVKLGGFPSPGNPFYWGGWNGTAHHVLLDLALTGIARCEVPGTLGPLVVLGPPRGSITSNGWGYSTAVTELNGSLTPSMFHPVVLPSTLLSTRTPPLSTVVTGFLVTNSTGSPLASYNFTTLTWTTGGGVALAVGDILQLNASVQIPGVALVLVANPPGSGEIGLYMT